eukprot:5087160-Pyramimonas_sp.AAC.1
MDVNTVCASMAATYHGFAKVSKEWLAKVRAGVPLCELEVTMTSVATDERPRWLVGEAAPSVGGLPESTTRRVGRARERRCRKRRCDERATKQIKLELIHKRRSQGPTATYDYEAAST